MQSHSEKIIFHELISTYICRTNEVISAVCIIIINIDCQLHVVVSITQLHQRNAKILPLRIQTVHHSFCSSNLDNIQWQFYNPNFDCMEYTFINLSVSLCLGLLRIKYGSLLVKKSQSARFLPSNNIFTIEPTIVTNNFFCCYSVSVVEADDC